MRPSGAPGAGGIHLSARPNSALALALVALAATTPLHTAALAVDAAAGTPGWDGGVHGSLPAELDLVASQGPAPRTVILDARWTIRDALGPGTLTLHPSDGLVVVDGATSRALVPGTGASRVVAHAADRGPFSVTLRFDGALGAAPHSQIAQAVFHFDDAGVLVAGWPYDPDALDVPADATRANAPVDALGARCTMTFRVRYLASEGASVPESHRREPVRHLQVRVFDADLSKLLASAYTDEDGEATFTITREPCQTTFRFVRVHRFVTDDGVERARGIDASGNVVAGVSPVVDMAGVERQNVLILEAHTGSAWMHSQVVHAFLRTASRGDHIVGIPVHVQWEFGQKSSVCRLACYVYGNPARIHVSHGYGLEYNGHAVYHEYGHHVHADVTSNTRPRPNYGDHGCGVPCHFWDSGHGTTGSAFLEAWADFYVGAIRNTGQPGPYDLDFPDRWRVDHRDLPCTGPFRICAVAGSLWTLWRAPGVTLADFITVMRSAPQDIYQFAQQWYRLDLPDRVTLATALQRNGIASAGDAARWTDAANAFSTATAVTRGGSGDLTHEPHWNPLDRDDFYRFRATAGDRISATLQPPLDADTDLYLIDPSGKARDTSTRRGDGVDESVTAVADVTGDWRILVRGVNGAQGLYALQLDVGTREPGRVPASGVCVDAVQSAGRELRIVPVVGAAAADAVGRTC